MSVTGRLRRLIPARRLGRDDDGAALLEFTVILPFLMVLGFGIFEFSNMLYQYHLITGGVRDAGRFAAGLPMPATVDQNETCDVSAPQSTPVGCAKLLAVTGQLASMRLPGA
jgi:Flp pilus assembly protein TadG